MNLAAVGVIGFANAAHSKVGARPPSVSISTHDHQALQRSTYPKLLFYGEPGALVSPEFAERFAVGLKNCRAINLGPGAHYLQEDHADAIGAALAPWIGEIANGSRRAA